MTGPPYAPPPPSALVLWHADEHLLILDKPAGLLTVPGRGPDKADCLWSRVREVFPDALVVHRLDMATSGIVVMARGARAQRHLSLQFQNRQVSKQYEARVAGRWSLDPAGSIDLPLGPDWPRRPRQQVDLTAGRPSLTRYRLLDSGSDSRLALEPVTGRAHQLRVHLAAVGHPILGDPLYGPKPLPDPTSADSPRLMLHACGIRLRHPALETVIACLSPAPF